MGRDLSEGWPGCKQLCVSTFPSPAQHCPNHERARHPKAQQACVDVFPEIVQIMTLLSARPAGQQEDQPSGELCLGVPVIPENP